MDSKPTVARSKNMARIKSKDTKAELVVRKLLRENGLTGYRLHWKKVPGSPDIAFPGRRVAIFVNGCFWHRHEGCKYAYTPKSRVMFWNKKFKENVERDQRNYETLKNAGWRVVIVWECELNSVDKAGIIDRIKVLF